MTDTISPPSSIRVDRDGDLWQPAGNGKWRCRTEPTQYLTPDMLDADYGPTVEYVPATRVAELDQQLADEIEEHGATVGKLRAAEARLTRAVTLPDRLINAWSHRLDAIHADVRRLGQRPDAQAVARLREAILTHSSAEYAAGVAAGERSKDAREHRNAANASLRSLIELVEEVTAPPPAHNSPAGCPTCTGPLRETAGMVCQGCGTDYTPEAPDGDREWSTAWDRLDDALTSWAAVPDADTTSELRAAIDAYQAVQDRQAVAAADGHHCQRITVGAADAPDTACCEHHLKRPPGQCDGACCHQCPDVHAPAAAATTGGEARA